MKKSLLLSIFLLVARAYGQSLPPVIFSGSQNICDPSPWQLVFYDEFNGNSLNPIWITYTDWLGLNPPKDDWGADARGFGQIGNNTSTKYLAIMKDADVEVSNGTVKLKVVKEPMSWHCATCTMSTITSNYSVGKISIPYTMPFNSGKFEARIKFPVFKYAWSAFWMWKGSSIDEIDVAEGFGRTQSDFAGGYPHVSHSIHAWNPEIDHLPNPYFMIHDKLTEDYPNQHWWQWNLNTTHFHQEDFHTYSCVWDPIYVSFAVDGHEVNTYHKYYQSVCHWNWYGFWNTCTHYNIYPSCTPSAGTYNILRGFPYNNQSKSNLILSPGISAEDGDRGQGFVGQMEVDYVKIWERHPENGWVGCADPEFTVTGPEVLCSNGTATYTVSTPSSSGTWSAPGLNIVSQNTSSITVSQNTANPSGQYTIQYTAPNTNCNSTYTAQASLYAGLVNNASVITTKTVMNFLPNPFGFNNLVLFYLHADPNVSLHYSAFHPITYTWDITTSDYPNTTIHSQGQTVSTPPVWNFTPGSLHTIDWTLHITNDCGTVTKTGQARYLLFKTTDTTNKLDQDTTNFYFSAVVPDTATDSFFTDVQNRVGNLFVADTVTDSVLVNSAISEMEMDALAPYLIVDSNYVNYFTKHHVNTNNVLPEATKTTVSPNPTTDLLNVNLGGLFAAGNLSINAYDILGRVQLHENMNHTPGSIIQISSLNIPNGVYILEMKQNATVERVKFIKQ